MTKKRTTKPVDAPEPPPMERFLKVEPLQLVGIPILAAVSIAGLFGAFDATSARSASSRTPLALHVEFPSRIPLEQPKPLSIEVRNESAGALDDVSVEIDRAYLDAFDRASFLPEPDEITPRAYVVDLGAIQPGEVRRIALEVRAEKVGRLAGKLRATSRGQELATIDLSTFVFP
jgi:hypothetical protein